MYYNLQETPHTIVFWYILSWNINNIPSLIHIVHSLVGVKWIVGDHLQVFLSLANLNIQVF